MTLDELVKLSYLLAKLNMHLQSDIEKLDIDDQLAVKKTCSDIELLRNIVREMPGCHE